MFSFSFSSSKLFISLRMSHRATIVLTVFKRFFDGFTIEGISLQNKGKLMNKKKEIFFSCYVKNSFFFFVITFFVYKFFSSFLHSRVPLCARYVHIVEDIENMSDKKFNKFSGWMENLNWIFWIFSKCFKRIWCSFY